MITAAVTQLPDRRALDADLERFVSTAEPVALALLDVDNLMHINSAHGLATGDRALATLVEVLSADSAGAVYRIAGDEFAIVLRGVTIEQAFLRLEAVRRQVEDAGGQAGLPPGMKLSIGAGVAHAPRDARSAHALFSAADAALGAAKEAGGNQVSLPPTEEMVMKSCYYAASSLRRLKALAERVSRTESSLLREGLEDLLRKYQADVTRESSEGAPR